MKIDLFANDLDQLLYKLAKKYSNALSACDRHVEKMAAHPQSSFGSSPTKAACKGRIDCVEPPGDSKRPVEICSGPASIGKNLGLSYGMGGLVLAVDFAL